MREMSKVTVCLLGIGMIFFVISDKALGGEPRTTESARHLIFLSLGVPGQRAESHVNGQQGEDVVKEMNQRGWERNEDYTQRLQNDAEFEWLQQNVQVLEKT